MSYDDYLCIKEVTKTVPITLSTADLGNEIIGISNVLDSWKCQYIQQLQGIVVSYRDVTLMSKNGYIKLDYPIIICNVNATFEVFIPAVGSIVKGKINRISQDYIGCLVHNTINVAIHRSRNEYDNIAHFISLDKVILFEITHIGFKRKIIRVKGRITQECVNLMKNMCSSIEATGAVHHIFTSPQESSSNTDSEEQESNNDRNSRNEMSESLCYNTNLFDDSLNGIKPGLSTKKKKKSNKFKTEQSHNSHFETVGTENGEFSPSLLCNSSRLFVNNLNDKSHDSPKKKREKSNVQTGHSSFKSHESTVESSEISSPNLLLNESDGLIRGNSTDRDFYHSQKKRKKKFETQQETDELLVNALLDITPGSNCYSPKKKKSKKDNGNSPNIVSPVLVKEEHSTDTLTDFSSSPKKKKHKKSKSNVLSSPSLFSDSQSSSKEEIEKFKIPKLSPKKQQKVSQGKFSAIEKRTNFKEFNSSVHKKDILNPFHTSLSLEKTDIKKENIDELIETLFPYHPSLGNEMGNEVLLNDKSLDSSKKAKKRKLESPNRDGLPKKKKKMEGSEVSLTKSSDKHKTKKKRKERPEKVSKKDKKKSKKRVISSKKKLPKLKKKKGEKLKKKLKKKSKHKMKDVP